MMAELKTRVDELKMENEYQLRLKDMNYNEKIKELTEKFIQEMESLKTKNQVLKTEKDKEEAKHEEELSELMEKHAKELQDLESANNQKLMLEYEKFQELQVRTSETINRQFFPLSLLFLNLMLLCIKLFNFWFYSPRVRKCRRIMRGSCRRCKITVRKP